MTRIKKGHWNWAFAIGGALGCWLTLPLLARLPAAADVYIEPAEESVAMDEGALASWRRPRSSIAVARYVPHLRILENGDVEIHGLLGLVVEPQKWRNPLHDLLLFPGFLVALGATRFA